MSNYMLREIKRLRIFKVNEDDVPKIRQLRFYCELHGETWALQIRSPLAKKNHRDGKDFCVAHATLNVADLIELRYAIDAALKTIGVALPVPNETTP